MVEVLREYFDRVHASDVYDYGAGYEVASFVGDGVDVLKAPADGVDWVITKPARGLAGRSPREVERRVRQAAGVAGLSSTGNGRYNRPTLIVAPHLDEIASWPTRTNCEP
jgi:hypothetical protein